MADSTDRAEKSTVGRRDFFKGAAPGAAGLVVTTRTEQRPRRPPLRLPPVTLPTDAHDLAYAQAQSTVVRREVVTPQGRPASDFMVDVLKKIGFEYAAINPGSTFQGLHESLINYGKNTRAGAPDLPARGSRRRHGARLRQGRRQADARRRARHRRPAALVDGAVPGLGRSRAGRPDRRPPPQSIRRDQPSAQRAGHGPARAQLRQVRRRGDDARAVRGVGDARVHDRDDAADGPGRADGRRGAAGVDRHERAAHSRAASAGAAAGRCRRRPRSGAHCWSTPRVR